MLFLRIFLNVLSLKYPLRIDFDLKFKSLEIDFFYIVKKFPPSFETVLEIYCKKVRSNLCANLSQERMCKISLWPKIVLDLLF